MREAAAAPPIATIHPFVLRRTKAEVAKDLPEKIETDQPLRAHRPSRLRLYADGAQSRCARRSWARSSGTAWRAPQLQILAGLTRLRQAACDPRLARACRARSVTRTSGKLVALRELIQTRRIDGGHRVAGVQLSS
jgi:SNF2 family DNA or RNA helicase